MAVPVALLASAPLGPAPLPAQAVHRGELEPELVVDSSDARDRARGAQAAFERARYLRLPASWSSGSGGECDEVVGRFCVWYSEGEWSPEPEDPEVGELREELLARLDSVALRIPGDDWVLGQRVWYRAEAGRWQEAARVARACGGASAWWCLALEGFAHHGAGRYEEAERVFRRALASMDPDEARRWRVPERILDGDARDALERAEDAAPDGADVLLERWWRLSDPLWLVPGNDRLTAHWARWVVATVRERARNPFRISWGRDLEELTVRHGWELGWERSRDRRLDGGGVTGHKHPEGRDYGPDGRTLLDPAASGPEAWIAGQRRPRSLYAPAYAPLLLPMDAQWAVFPRSDRFAVVATHPLPADTGRHAGHGHARPWMEPGDQADLVDRSGLFLVPVDGRDPERAARSAVRPGTDGASVLEAPAGAWVGSSEAWSPRKRRAGRYRTGLSVPARAIDVPTLSDLLLVRGGKESAPADLSEAARWALPRPEATAGRAFGVVWELSGVEGGLPVRYRVSLREADTGLLTRAGRWLGLVDDERPLELTWEEPSPEAADPALRHLRIEAAGVEPGRYTLRLEATLPGRSPLVSERPMRLVADTGLP